MGVHLIPLTRGPETGARKLASVSGASVIQSGARFFWRQGCVQLRRLPARRLCRRPNGMAPVAGECTERTVRIDVNMNIIN